MRQASELRVSGTIVSLVWIQKNCYLVCYLTLLQRRLGQWPRHKMHAPQVWVDQVEYGKGINCRKTCTTSVDWPGWVWKPSTQKNCPTRAIYNKVIYKSENQACLKQPCASETLAETKCRPEGKTVVTGYHKCGLTRSSMEGKGIAGKPAPQEWIDQVEYGSA